jgi:2-polyprenyl-3-methyl-5-hydroxy-6-metoxy-1,4-benzoquinol methylase
MKIFTRIKRIKKVFIELEKSQEAPNFEYNSKLIQEVDSFKKNISTAGISPITVPQSNPEIDYEFLRLSDISKLLLEKKHVNWRLDCERQVALDSADHIHPRGVKSDETRSPGFVEAVKNYFGRTVSYLDLGSAGGGLVYDFILENCKAVGVEGSDYSRNRRRAYWREIPWALFTADLTYAIQLYENDLPAKFDVIGAWEFFEHISENDIPSVLQNIKKHLKDENSLFLANIATFADHDGHTHWHQTIQSYDWWKLNFENHGFEVIAYPFSQELNPRGSGNNLGTWQGDYDIQADASLGFTIAARKSN